MSDLTSPEYPVEWVTPEKIYEVPDPANGRGLLNIGPAGKSFLVCRGIAGGMEYMEDAHQNNVDRIAMMLWMGWMRADGSESPEAIAQATGEDVEDAAPVETGEDDWDSATAGDPDGCHECGGTGRVLDGETCDGCVGTGKEGYARTLALAEMEEETRHYGMMSPGERAARDNQAMAESTAGWERV